MKNYTKFRGTLDEEPLHLEDEHIDNDISTPTNGDKKNGGPQEDPQNLDVNIDAPSDEKTDTNGDIEGQEDDLKNGKTKDKEETNGKSENKLETNGKNGKDKKNGDKSKSFGNRKLINVTMNNKFSLGKNKGSGGKTWVHPPEALLKGHIVYNVKFLGHVEVDQPKGADVVKDAIRKMKFNKQVKKAEGQKTPKVELTISIDGVTVQEPKYKVVQHRYPLHRISYCADDKSDKRIFSFIAKHQETNVQYCFVFDSEKCAEEITLTIGQAFDLAYKRFLESSSKDIDLKKQYLMAQRKVQQLTQENLSLKARVADLERMIDPHLLNEYEKKQPNGAVNNNNDTLAEPVVGRKLENLLLDEQPTTQQNGLTPQQVPALAPPPPVPARNNIPATAETTQPTAGGDIDLFGATPFTPTKPVIAPSGPPAHPTNPFASPAAPQKQQGSDPFGMDDFSTKGTQDIDQQIQNVDRELLDLQTGFSQGLSMCADDFSLADLDPLSKK